MVRHAARTDLPRERSGPRSNEQTSFSHIVDESSRISRAAAVFGVSSVIAYAAIVVFRQDALSEYIGLRGGPAQLTARVLRTPVGETTGALALPSRIRLQRGHAGHDHHRGRVRTNPPVLRREKPSKPPKAASIAPTTWGSRTRSNTTCSSARRTGRSASTSPTTSTGAARRARSTNASTAVGRRSTIRPRSPIKAHALRMSTIGNGSRCLFPKTRSSDSRHSQRALCAEWAGSSGSSTRAGCSFARRVAPWTSPSPVASTTRPTWCATGIRWPGARRGSGSSASSRFYKTMKSAAAMIDACPSSRASA